MDLEQWKKDAGALAVIYMMLERGKRLSVLLEGEDIALDPLLTEMHAHDLLTIDGDNMWAVTDKGKTLRTSMVAMYDLLQQYEIFGAVNLERLPPEAEDPQNPGQVHGSWPDPRFEERPGSSWDLRLCMMDFAGNQPGSPMAGKIDLHLIVFMQKLADGELDGPDFWPNLLLGLRPAGALLPPGSRPPTTFENIEAIVANAYYWRNAGTDEAQARAETQVLYTAGMLEQQKRDGATCSACGGYLAVYELWAKRNGETLDMCPCGASFTPPAPETVEESCPSCHAVIGPTDTRCRGCGATIDRSMAPGSVSTTTTVETVTEVVSQPIWGYDYGYYGYTPIVGYLDPWDIALNVALFSVFDPLWW